MWKEENLFAKENTVQVKNVLGSPRLRRSLVCGYRSAFGSSFSAQHTKKIAFVIILLACLFVL